MVDLQLALNGDTTHPAMPRTADEIARDAAACVAAGATLLHLHAFDDDGDESLAAGPVGRMLRAVRAACPGIPVNVTTFAAIVPDPRERLDLVSSWTELPDLVAANQGEAGIDDVSEVLARRGVGIEACLLSGSDADRFVRAGRHERFVRVVVEPLLEDVDDALALDAELESMLDAAGVTLPQLHHGIGAASWQVSRRALARGHAIRTGLEDTSVLEDGTAATSNRQLAAAAAAMVSGGAPAAR
ncbi:3-keto-5-aminohexanoate cleavage protein [Curtobacterium sp. NPDC087082]|uniref:3-keto-5-aminohexanoate cleavage protein n=1 Tax=Curtobacterium sp. NPDC087082 TaxID=3363966 RepID=UPI0038009D4E